MNIRQPIVTVAGHVDHGKTSILDCFRGSYVQQGEAGGITQKISFTKYPSEKIKEACPYIEKENIRLEIPGFLFIDTPGHAAFTNLRKRGGSLADLTILVVSAKEGIKPQTAEVLQILKNNKTPFLIAFNKIDTISGWRSGENDMLKKSIESQALNVSQEFQEALLTFQGSLEEHGFKSNLYYNVRDFTKEIAIVPCSAKTKQGIPELLLTLCGLSQRFLKKTLGLGKEARGVMLEVKKERAMEYVEVVLYDGTLKLNDEIAVATFDDILRTKIRAMQEILPLSFKYIPKKEAAAATGLRLSLTNKENLLPGMPFQIIRDNLEEIRERFKKELSQAIRLDKQGVIVKADSLGSLEALMTLLKQENIPIVKAGIGDINKTDIIAAKANLKINPLDAAILGFNVGLCEGVHEDKNLKVFLNDVVYKMIENLQEWRSDKQNEIERGRVLSLAPICKLEILRQYVFRNLNPAVFGVRVVAGKLKSGIKLIDQNGSEVARVRQIQHEKESIAQAEEHQEVAISLPGVNFERKLKDKQFLYSEMTEKQFKDFKKNKDLLSSSELKVLQEIAGIKKKKKDNWGD